MTPLVRRDTRRQGLHGDVSALAVALGLLGLMVIPSPSSALEAGASVRAGATLSDNMRLEPDSTADAGMFFEVVPNLRLSEKKARYEGLLSYAPSLFYYPFESDKLNTHNTLAAVGKLEAVQDHLFINADANISQSYLTPFGATAVEGSGDSSNFLDTTILGLSPAWVGRIGSDKRYELRYTWKHVSTQSGSTQDSEATQWSALLDKAIVHHWGWGLSFQRRATDFSVRPDTHDQRSIASLRLRVNPELTLSVSGGYESNSFTADDRSTANYGMGMVWLPSNRTEFSANWDHRYFGEAYAISLSHRFRRSRLSFVADRDASTFAERFLDQGLINPETGELLVNERLDRLYPDPGNRQAVADYLKSRGYTEETLFGAYTDEITRRNSIRLSYDIYGARNKLLVSIFRREIDTVIESFSPNIQADLGLNSNNIQKGLSITHTYTLSPRALLTSNYNRANTVSTIPGNNGESTENGLRVSVTQRLTAKSSATLGARYVNLDSNLGTGYTERAVFGTISHTF